MTEDEVRCPNCGAAAYWEIDGKSFECMECHNVWEMSEDETMRKYAEAHGCGTLDITPCWAKGYGGEQEKIWCGQEYAKAAGLGVRPLPCVRDERGETREQAIKQLFAKINEELDELKDACGFVRERNFDTVGEFRECQFNRRFDCIEIFQHIADEAADTITAITTMLEALGVDAEMRDEAQRRVNEKNRKRNRL